MASSRAAAAGGGGGARKDKDRSYRHVFKGLVLVNTLLDYDANRFANRQAAVKFAQKLLDLGQVESIVGKRSFEDGVALYRWCDETVVREAKKIAHTTTTTHIPKRRLIELLEIQHADGPEAGNSVDKARETFNNTATPTATTTAPTTTTTTPKSTPARKTSSGRQPRAASSGAQQSRSSSIGPQQRRQRSTQRPNANNNNSAAKPARTRSNVGRTPASKAGPSAASPAAKTGPSATSAAPKAGPSAMSPASHARGSATTNSAKPDAPHDGPTRTRSTELVRCPDSSLRSRNATDSARAQEAATRNATDSARAQEAATRNATDSARVQEAASRNATDSARVQEAARAQEVSRPKDATLVRVDTSIERHVNSVLESPANQSLAVPDDYNEFDSDVFASPATSPGFTAQQSTTPRTQATSQASPCNDVTVEADAVTSGSGDDSSLTGVTGDLATLTAENSGFSDNEKQLLSQMRRMQEEHKTSVTQYEEQITKLMATISELKVLSQQKPEVKEAPAPMAAPAAPPAAPAMQDTPEAPPLPGTAPAVPPAPPPPSGAVPPPPPVPGLNTPLKAKVTAQPTRAAVVPRVKMRPLFWSRMLLNQYCEDDEDTFWHRAEEPNFDVDEFEALFGRDPAKETPKKSLHETINTKKDKAPKQQHVKLLDENRSRAVGIKLRSLHCDMKDIRNAVYKMSFGKLDVESLHGLYEIKGTEEEIGKITAYQHDHHGASFDQPEQFLLELSKMPQFSERVECLIFRKTFNETLFNIDQQLDMVEQGCQTLRDSNIIESVLELVLAFGNYMNGGTQRGQADAFDLEILTKLKDLKSMDKSTNLLRHIVHVQAVEECDAGKHEAQCRLPDTATFTQASTVSFREVTAELSKLKTQLKQHSRKADIVCLHSDNSNLQPFKDQMEDFFDTADTMLKSQLEKLDITREAFEHLLAYYMVKDTQTSPENFFALWVTFIDDYKALWKVEHKNIAKNMFNKVQDRRRRRQMMRRQSVVDEGKSGTLKQKFRSLRRRSMAEDAQSPGQLLRSQSVCAVNAVGVDDAESHCATEPRRARRSRLNTQASADVTASMTSLSSIAHDSPGGPADTPVRMRERNNLMRSRSTVGAPREEAGETMRERMRRNRLSADVQSSPRHTPEPSPDTPTRTPDGRSVRMRLARMASESAASPGGGESIKERMDRRRRERQGTASDSNALSPGGPSSSITGRLPSTRPSIDLASLKQKFGGDTKSESTSSPVSQRAQVSRRASSSSLDVRNRMNSASEKDIDSPKAASGRLARSRALSGSQDSLAIKNTKEQASSSSDMSRRQRRESWRGSHSNLADTNTPAKPTKEREPISWRSPKPSSGSESETTTRTAPPSRQKSTPSARSGSHRDPISWRGSQSDLSGSASGSLRGNRDSWRGSHQNLSTSNDSEESSLRARRRESWRGSHSNLSTVGNSTPDGSSARSRRKEAWRSSQSNLADTADTSSPRLRRSSSRTSVNDLGTDAHRVQRAGSRTVVNDSGTDSPRLRRSSSRTAVNDSSTDSARISRAGSRSALNDTSADPNRRARTRESSGKTPQQTGVQSSTVSSVVAADSKLPPKDEDALLERDYRERLKKLSRSRQNLYDGKR